MDQLNANTKLARQLVIAGACTEEVAAEFEQRAAAAWVPLGKVLVTTGKLRLRQIGEILMAQAEDPTALFGDVAVALGHCSAEDIETAVRHQAERCPHVFDLALSDGRVDRGRLIEAMRVYIRQVERLSSRMADALGVGL